MTCKPKPARMHQIMADLASTQAEVVDFLGRAVTYNAPVARVDRIETHGALVFLAGNDVYKIKRAVRFPYMDFSTLELRRRACAREIEVNAPNAPGLYLGAVAITRRADGRADIDGTASRVEWAVHMRRFADADLLSNVAETKPDRHAARPPDRRRRHRLSPGGTDQQGPGPTRPDGRNHCRGGRWSWCQRLRSAGGHDRRVRGRVQATTRRLPRPYSRSGAPRAGFVRRCHGDLHLANIVIWHGSPTLFDAIEFDEALATIDTLYDLAFLLMDLDRRGNRLAANVVLNRYLWRSQQILDLDGLAALPLFLGLRAGIRAMVLAQRAAQVAEPPDAERRAKVLMDISPQPSNICRRPEPLLIAVGGLSGTGKSTLASRARADDRANAGRRPPEKRSRAQGAVRRGGDRAAVRRVLFRECQRADLCPAQQQGPKCIGRRARRDCGRRLPERGGAAGDRIGGALAVASVPWVVAVGSPPKPCSRGLRPEPAMLPMPRSMSSDSSSPWGPRAATGRGSMPAGRPAKLSMRLGSF